MYKTVLLYLPSTHSAETVAVEAAKLAKQHGATLIGAHNVITITVYGGLPADIIAEHNERERKEAEAVRAIFEDVAKRYDLPHEWRNRPARDTDAFRDIVSQCHGVDLVVAPGKDFHDPLGQWFDLPERLALEGGRPVLMLPRDRQIDGLGKRILVAWNGSRESARAAFDAMPLLKAAESVSVLAICESPEGRLAASAKDLTAALQRHGVKAELASVAGTKKPDGEELLGHVAERNCDLLVMGFYGHSRLREMVWGGATRHILKAMTVPVFTSH
jgi:nucleotide-binding universal stress UspA family protein